MPSIRKPGRERNRAFPRRHISYIAEALENRLLLSAVNWTGAAGDNQWTTPGNWSTNALPGPGDDVTINAAGTRTITLGSGTQSVNSVTATDPLAITGGALFVAATSQVATLTVVGTLSGSGDVTITNSLTWAGGTMSGTGRTILASGATADMSISEAALGREFDNSGTFTFEDNTGVESLAGPGFVFNNLARGVVNTQAGSRAIVFTAAAAVFNNAGIFNNMGTGTTIFNGLVFNNTGTLNVQAGKVILGGGGTSSSSMNVSAQGTLSVSAAYTYVAGALISGPGTIGFDGGDQTFAPGQFLPTGVVDFNVGTITVNNTITPSALGRVSQANVVFNTPQTFANLSLAQTGVISGSGDVTITNSLTWAGGTMSGTGRTILASSATANLISYADLNREFDNAGTFNISDTTTGNGLTSGGPGSTSVFDNLVGGVVNTDAITTGIIFGAPLVFNNAGTLNSLGSNTTEFNSSVLNNAGIVDVHAGTLVLLLGGGQFLIQPGVFQSQPGTTLTIEGSLLGSTRDRNLFSPLGTLSFIGGVPSAPDLLEALSADVGFSSTGFTDNFKYSTIALTTGAYVRLVDQFRNSVDTGSEAIYVNTLIVPAGSTLDLNGLNLYARATQINGTILNGSVTTGPDGGAIALGVSTPGAILPVGNVDDWTFFGRAGEAVTVVLDTGSTAPTAPTPPLLGYGQVQLLDPVGNVLTSADNTASGADTIVTLPGVALPADGTYHIRIAAPPSQSQSIGHYTFGVYNATVTSGTFALDDLVTGTLGNQYEARRWIFSAPAGQDVQFHLVNESSASIVFNLTSPDGSTVLDAINAESPVVTLPASGAYTLVAQSSGATGGNYAFNLFGVSVTTLTSGEIYSGALIGSGQSELFRIGVPSPQPLVFQYEGSTGDDVKLYAGFGAPPTPGNYAYRGASGNFGSVDVGQQRILVPSAAAGTWYVLLYGSSVPMPSSFTLAAVLAPIQVTDMTPTNALIGSDATLTLTGAGFEPGSTVELIAGNQVLEAGTVSVETGSRMTAYFARVSGTNYSTYDLRVTRPDGASAVVSNALQMISSYYSGQLFVNAAVSVPGALGRHGTATLYMSITNYTNSPVPAPLVTLSTTDPTVRPLLTLDPSLATQGLVTSTLPPGFSNSITVLASTPGTPGVLQPGSQVFFPVYYAGLQMPWNFSASSVQFQVGSSYAYVPDTSPIDWSAQEQVLRPPGIPVAAWTPIFNNFQRSVGTTVQSFVQALDNDAAYLAQQGEESVVDAGQPVRGVVSVGYLSGPQAKVFLDPSQFIAFEFQQADADITPIRQLASAIDASVATPGLASSFSRAFNEPISSRYTLSPLGYGWSSSWYTTLSAASDGTVTVAGPGGSQRVFTPSTQAPGTYSDQPGDHGTLDPLLGGAFTLAESDGTTTAFLPHGQINYVQDTNGNRITAGYDASGNLISLAASSGQHLDFTYNAAGLLAGVTDSDGRVNAYTYDSNHQLIEVDSPHGRTLYGYNNGSGAATEHALTSIQFPDGTHRFYTFDSQGRLASTSRDGNAEAVTFSYDQPGEVTVTDANGNSGRLFFDARGLLVKTADPLGNLTSFSFDNNLNLTGVTDAADQIQSFAYDKFGNLTSATDQLHNTTSFTYGPLNRLTSVTDANGNKTGYAYDPSGNLLTTTYVDNSQEHVTYDPLGDATSFTNRRGQGIGYTYNVAGQVTQQRFADGTHDDYTYDAHGNLTSVADPTGQTSFAYDSADRLTEVDYPPSAGSGQAGAMFLKFTYDSGGRRIKMVDQTGFAVKYAYDAAGRLHQLTDAGGNSIVIYTYDAAGNLSRKDNGNGTYTSYQYDAAGNVLHLVNLAPDGSVNSRFDYTYNSLCQETTEITIDGTWTYSYDGTGQLTHAVFASINPAIANQDLTYAYDPVGNRIRTIENGVTTEYKTNNLNEYTSVGGVLYTYDLDGNLTSDGTSAYTYNALNQLTGVANSQGTWQYVYDGLGWRIGSTQDGSVTHYVLDPAGFRNIAAVYDGNGNSVSHYTYGLGLASQFTTGGGSYFYDFNGQGSTVGLTDASGRYSSTSRYLPFGKVFSSDGLTTNPFGFVGQFGVQSDGSGVQAMGARFYTPYSGRFVTNDPLRLAGGSINLLSYARNNPEGEIDPSGLSGIPDWTRSHPLATASIVAGAALALPLVIAGGTYLVATAPIWLPAVYTGANGAVIWLSAASGLTTLYIENPEINDAIVWGFGKIGGQLTGAQLPIELPNPATVLLDFTTSLGELIGNLIENVGDSVSTKVVGSFDPNAKFGPTGYGPSHFVSATSVLPYRIDFENDPSATAPAQQVVITDQLDPNLDWSTFLLTQIGFGDTNITVPTNSQHFETTVPVTENGESFVVQIEAGIDLLTGLITIRFQSIDPNTDLPPDVLTGFLPPEDDTGRGMGYVSYIVMPKAGLATGTQIRNVALVTFDANQPVATDQVNDEDPTQGVDPAKQDLNTIDSGVPTSSVSALLDTEFGASFPVSWAGQDDAGGSGVGSYNVYVSIDSGPFALWLANATQTSAMYSGVNGHTYAFYSVATDNVGNVQPTPIAAQAVTKVVLVPGDVNADGTVNFSDLLILAQHYGQAGTFAQGDLNGDGSVNFADLLILAQNYGRSASGAGTAAAAASGLEAVVLRQRIKPRTIVRH